MLTTLTPGLRSDAACAIGGVEIEVEPGRVETQATAPRDRRAEVDFAGGAVMVDVRRRSVSTRTECATLVSEA